MNKIKILIADDHELVRQGVRHTLVANANWEVVGEACNGREAVELSHRLQPDIAVLDLSMPELNGLEAIRQIVGHSPQIRILVLSIHDSDTLIHEVLAAGAKGYLLKSDAARDLVTAVQSLAEGRPFFTAKVSQTLLDSYLHSGLPRRVEEKSRLTAREQEIVSLIAEGKSNKEVASILNISVRTVETHRSNIMEKLGIRCVSDLVIFAVRTGLRKSDAANGGVNVRRYQ